MGHETDQITDRHSGKVTEIQRAQMMEQLASPQHFSDAEMSLMLDYQDHRLTPGTEEFEYARALVLKRFEVWDG